MANFYSMFAFLAVSSFVESDPGPFDMLSRLPIEMALTVLRLLPARDLLNTLRVNTKWRELCKSDPKLRQKVRRYLRRMNRLREFVEQSERSENRILVPYHRDVFKKPRNVKVVKKVRNRESSAKKLRI